MSQEYRNVCDVCGKETKGFSSPEWGAEGYKEVAKNNWDVRIYSHWLEGSDDAESKELVTRNEVSMDACLECMGRIKDAITVEVAKIGIEKVAIAKAREEYKKTGGVPCGEEMTP